MHSNLITPPDTVDDDLYTITLINATVDDVELITHICESTAECYNIYLYSDNMDNLSWLDQALSKSNEIIINCDVLGHDNLYKDSRTCYYGNKILLAPAKKIDSLMQFFLHRNQLSK